LGDFFLSQIVGDANRAARGGAETLSERQELFGDPAWRIGVDQVSEIVVRPAQPAGQNA
jgi:hypothetical protein